MITGVGLLGFFAGTAAAQQAEPHAAIPDGATLFRDRGCGQCHQIRGVGGHKGPDLSGVGRKLKKPQITQQIVNGGDAMPAFGNVLPQPEIAALVKYLRHQRQKTKKPAKAAPAPAPAPVPAPE
jgi:ubiquinol-cytochrome c reductase cytochrome b subunit